MPGQNYNPYSTSVTAMTATATTAATPVQYSHGPVIYGPNGQIQSPLQMAVPNLLTSTNEMSTTQITTNESQPQLVPYGSTSQKQLSRPSFIVPPADVQIIIDKMASYVAKNGRDFEAIVKKQGRSEIQFSRIIASVPRLLCAQIDNIRRCSKPESIDRGRAITETGAARRKAEEAGGIAKEATKNGGSAEESEDDTSEKRNASQG